MSASNDELGRLRARAQSAGKAKALLGAVGVPLVTGALTWLLMAADGPGFIVACFVALGLAQAGYLVFRGIRQIRVGSGEVHEAVVLDAVEQGTGKPEERALTYQLRVEVTLPSSGETAIPVVALSTNVFSETMAKAAEGKRIRVIWHPAYPGEVYAALE